MKWTSLENLSLNLLLSPLSPSFILFPELRDHAAQKAIKWEPTGLARSVALGNTVPLLHLDSPIKLGDSEVTIWFLREKFSLKEVFT